MHCTSIRAVTSTVMLELRRITRKIYNEAIEGFGLFISFVHDVDEVKLRCI